MTGSRGKRLVWLGPQIKLHLPTTLQLSYFFNSVVRLRTPSISYFNKKKIENKKLVFLISIRNTSNKQDKTSFRGVAGFTF